ncbi:MAG: hypothetical protein PUE08_03495 [Eubacteriales bacterium]|nr:hypothetical protein [Eubacteriales bacterium]
MKRKHSDAISLILLLTAAGMLICFSAEAKEGAYNGYVLAQSTIIPSLTPLLIIFLIVMKTGAKDVLAKALGFLSHYVLNLPYVVFPAVFLGMLGGYPTGAMLTGELSEGGDIDKKQARRMMRFNFCGGAGFIITAVGTATLNSRRAGVILFLSNVTASMLLGFILSFTEKRTEEKFYSNGERLGFADAMCQSVTSAVGSVLNITAYIIFFSAFSGIFNIGKYLMPLLEITNGVCGENRFSLPLVSGYLAFGGLCIHLQLLPFIRQADMKLWDFCLFRGLSAALSYGVCRVLLLIFPLEQEVFNQSAQAVRLSSENALLSFLLILGCFVLVLDTRSKKSVV